MHQLFPYRRGRHSIRRPALPAACANSIFHTKDGSFSNGFMMKVLPQAILNETSTVESSREN